MVALLTVISAVTAAAPASAFDPCKEERPTYRCFIPQPVRHAPARTTAITSIEPAYGWGSDTITLYGTRLNGVLTVNGEPVAYHTIVSGITFVMPRQPVLEPPEPVRVTMTSSSGSASVDFTVSPTITLEGTAPLRDGSDGWASASLSLDRSSGILAGSVTLTNEQAWATLVVDVSAVWTDRTGHVLGYTSPTSVSAKPVFPTVGANTTTQKYAEVEGPGPAQAPYVHGGAVLIVENHEAQFEADLQTAVQTGETLAELIGKVSALLG